MKGGGGGASLGGGGGGVSGGGFFNSSIIFVSIGCLIASTTLRASPVTRAYPTITCMMTTMVNPSRCLEEFLCCCAKSNPVSFKKHARSWRVEHTEPSLTYSQTGIVVPEGPEF
jgi:hypothetical protein